MVDSDLFSFPLLIDIVDADLAVKAQVDADDIVFTGKTGSVLSHEIERFDGATGGLVAWVNIPYISSLESTAVYMYYGNPSCGNQEDIGGTWSSEFMTVHHLNEDWSTVSDHFIDSTSYGHDGTLSDGDADSMSDSGMIGDGFRFSGDGDMIDIGVVDHGQPISFSCWLKADEIDFNGCALGRFYFGYFLGTWNSGSGVLRHNVYVDGNVLYNVEGGVLSDEWYYLSVSYDGSVVRYYVNGVEVGSRSVSGSLSNTNYRWHIGDDGHGGFPFDGVVDEVRIANFCFSADWFNACFDNVISDDFYVVGGEEDQSISSPLV